MAKQGWIGIRLPEADGGIGFGLHEYGALAEELGRHLAPEPVIQSVLTASFTHPMRSDVLRGTRFVAPVLLGPDGSGPTLVIHKDGISGTVDIVPMAAAADAYLVQTVEGFVFVRSQESTVQVVPHLTQDGGAVCTVTFRNALFSPVAPPRKAVIEEAVLASACYLLGAMDQALEITLQFLKERRQFGRPIGSFQVLQHRVVDMRTQVMLTKASLRRAIAMVERSDGAGEGTQMAVSRAKLRASNAAFLIGRQCVQLHGASGISDEGDIGLYLRKILTHYQQFGTTRQHSQRYEQLLCRKLHSDDDT
jgi:alkylation response protein AidB-like acyl-CoA dehydrogenase